MLSHACRVSVAPGRRREERGVAWPLGRGTQTACETSSAILSVYVCMCIYIYIYRERERYMYINTYQYIMMIITNIIIVIMYIHICNIM